MKPANDNRHSDGRQQQFLAADVASLEAAFADMLAAFPELAEDEQLRADTIEGETNAFEILARLLDQERDANAMMAAVASRISDLQARKARAERRKDAMRGLMLRLLKSSGLPRVQLAEATVSIGKKAAAVEIVDETLLPANVVRTTVTPDKKAIAELLKAGAEVPGARMGEVGESLTVRAA